MERIKPFIGKAKNAYEHFMATFGCYPEHYEPECHGVYDPSRYYGCNGDTPLGDVKLGDLYCWLRSREYTPSSMAGAVSRAYWRWNLKYVQPKRAGIAPFFQLTIATMMFFYIINYGKIRRHRNYKYH